MPTPRWILHADMDAFYASVEQREDPALVGRPVIVGATSPRGVVAAASYEARVFGVRSAMPGFRARELCPNGVYLPARMDLYADVSRQVHEVFLEFTPVFEPLSLDEAFLDVAGSLHLFGGPEELGRALKRRVREVTRLNVSVGLGPTKLVAKVACTLGKPNGLRVVPPNEVRALLDPLPVRRLWGVGPVMAERLRGLGIETIRDLAECEPSRLTAELGPFGLELRARAHGEDSSPVESERQAKSCGEENTFEVDVYDRDTVSATLTAHAEAVAARLRRAQLRGRTVTLKIKLARAVGEHRSRTGPDQEPHYPLLSRSRSLPVATADGKRIRDVAVALWDEASIREPVRLLGVSLSNLESSETAQQLDLFGETKRSEKLGATLDRIRDRFGHDAIQRAVGTPEKVTPSGRRKV